MDEKPGRGPLYLRALVWDNVDLEVSRLHVVQWLNRKGEAGQTKTETSVRTVPVPKYLVPDLRRWKLECPLSRAGFVFPGEEDANGERGPIAADVVLRHILRRALGIYTHAMRRQHDDSADLIAVAAGLAPPAEPRGNDVETNSALESSNRVQDVDSDCRLRDLNPRPTVYKTAALPLS